MGRLKIITKLGAIFCFVFLMGVTSNSFAHNSPNTPSPTPNIGTTILKGLDGGVRTIVQGRQGSVEIHQETPTPLTIEVYDSSNRRIYSVVSSQLGTVIYTDGWSRGHYVIKTSAANETTSQNFNIIIR